MERNENGYPETHSVKDQIENGNCQNGMNGCGTAPEGVRLAYLHSPDQRFRMLYSAEDALKHGTLFEELYKPMEVYGCE